MTTVSQTFVIHTELIRENCLRFIMNLDLKKPVEVTLKTHRRTRTQAQNRYLWGVCYKTLEESTGQSADDWHEYFMGEVFGWEKAKLFDREIIRPVRRSSTLDTEQFSNYVAQVQRRAAEYGIFIPDPGV